MDEKFDGLTSFTALREKIVFIHHVKGSKPMTQVLDVVRRLHGTLSEFFDNRVDIVITNQNDGILPRRSDNYPDALSPALTRGSSFDYVRSSPLGTPLGPSSTATQASSFSQPSPLNSNSPYSSQSSPFALSPGSGGGICNQKYPSIALQSSSLSRGQRMTMLARNSGSVDGIIEKAMRRKICILTIKEFWKWFRSLPTEIQVYCEECTPRTVTEDKKLDQSIGVKPIRPPCIKVISSNHTERSFYVEATHFEPQLWPAEDFAPLRGKQAAENGDAAVTEAPVKKLSVTRNVGLAVQKRWKHRITKAKKRKLAKVNICEACHGSYNNLNKHLKSEKHSDFAAKADEHFSGVDQVIATFPDFASVIATAKERQSYQNQLRVKNCSTSVDSRKSTELSADSELLERDLNHIKHDVSSTTMTGEAEAGSGVPKDIDLKNGRLSAGMDKDTVPVDRIAAENGNEKENGPLQTSQRISQVNGCQSIVEEANSGKTAPLCDQTRKIKDNSPHGELSTEKQSVGSCPHLNGKESFVHEVDLDLTPIKDTCEICQDPSVQFANSCVNPDENAPVFHRSVFGTDSFNSPWNDVLYKDLVGDCNSGLLGLSCSASQSCQEVSDIKLAAPLHMDMTPLSNVGPFVQDSPYSPAPFTRTHTPPHLQDISSNVPAVKMDCDFLSDTFSGSHDVSKVNEPSLFSSPIPSRGIQPELSDKPTMFPAVKDSDNDDSAFLESPFSISRPLLRARSHGITSSPRRRHSTRLFVRMGGQASPEVSNRAATPEMDCRFAFCSNCDAFHLKPKSIPPEQIDAEKPVSCLSSSPVVRSPSRVKRRLMKSPPRLELEGDAENSLSPARTGAGPSKKRRVLGECQIDPQPNSPSSSHRKRPRVCVDDDPDAVTSLLHHLHDQLPSDVVESSNNDSKSVTSEYSSPSRRRRVKK